MDMINNCSNENFKKKLKEINFLYYIINYKN